MLNRKHLPKNRPRVVVGVEAAIVTSAVKIEAIKIVTVAILRIRIGRMINARPAQRTTTNAATKRMKAVIPDREIDPDHKNHGVIGKTGRAIDANAKTSLRSPSQ
jgi:hypothetical protein